MYIFKIDLLNKTCSFAGGSLHHRITALNWTDLHYYTSSSGQPTHCNKNSLPRETTSLFTWRLIDWLISAVVNNINEWQKDINVGNTLN